MQPNARVSHLFPYVAGTTVLLTVGLIIFGAVVRVTDSGLGCGNEWPLCDGSIIPPLDNVTAWIEWLHRLFAVLIGLFGIGMLALAINVYRSANRTVLIATVAAALLFFAQSMLGALVVIWELPPTAVTLHLGTAMLLLGALLLAAFSAVYRPPQRYARDNFTMLAYIAAALSLVIILTGALVRGSGATLACIDWPLCNGSVFPLNQGQLALIHWTHRAAVLGFGVVLIFLTWSAWRMRTQRLVRQLTVVALCLYLTQSGIGAMYVLSVARPEWGASHVGFAALTWASLVLLCAVETLNTQPERVENAWKLQSESQAA
jgi:heme A synthase